MSVLPITFIVSACLLAIFIIYFARTHSGQRQRGVDHESLLPLEEETPRVVGGDRKKARSGAGTSDADEQGAGRPDVSDSAAGGAGQPLDDSRRSGR